MKILLGPAGTPAKSTLEGLALVHEAGLHAMEVAFTHGVRMGNDTAKQIFMENDKYGIALSIHAPYYINLASTDEKKVKESKQRILDSCERAVHMGAKRVVFHAAYYGQLSKEDVFGKVSDEASDLVEEIKKNGWDVSVLAETMGRVSQFGDLDELILLRKKTGCDFCIDPAHLFARNIGQIDFSDLFDKLEKTKKKDLHFHFSAINYGPKGERNHLVLGKGGPSFPDFAKELLKRKSKFDSATIISESPITWHDSINMKKTLAGMGHRFQ